MINDLPQFDRLPLIPQLEEVEIVLLAIGRKWAATSKQNNISQLPAYAEVS